MELNNVIRSAKARFHIMHTMDFRMSKGYALNLFALMAWNFPIEQYGERLLENAKSTPENVAGDQKADQRVDRLQTCPGREHNREADADIDNDISLVMHRIRADRHAACSTRHEELVGNQ